MDFFLHAGVVVRKKK